MPPAVEANGVNDVEVEQLDLQIGKAVVQGLVKIPVIVIAQPAAGALGVDDDCDRGIRPRRRGDLGEVADSVEQLE